MKRQLETAAPDAQQSQGDLHVSEPIPDVCFIPDICKALGISRRTVTRLLRHGAFPIPEMQALDHKHRWSGALVRQFRDTPARHARSVSRLRVVRKAKPVDGNRIDR